jgi:tRNA(Ile)-lysidine synthase
MGLHPSVAACRAGVRRALGDLVPGDVVVVACSGGADSLALLAATLAEGRRGGWRVVGATVDHGMQEGSAEVAARVTEQMAALGVDETVAARVSVTAEGIGPEAAAREARYAVLAEIAERFGAAAVLLGHTRDDQAETVLLGLTRGSGGRALAGMRRSFDHYRRPLLDVGRTDTVTACRVEGLEFWDDPHNADPRFLRSRVRTRVLPVLEEELGPGVAVTLARTADALREDAELLDDLAATSYAGLPRPLAVADLEVLATALRRRVLRLAALDAGATAAELFREHVLAVDSLITDWRGQRWIDLPGHVRVRRDDGVLLWEQGRGSEERPDHPG